jgi:Nup93/Nic96
MRILKETGTEDRLETFQILMDLFNVFEYVKMKDYGNAWACLDQLPLLPSSEAECTIRARHYSSLDPAIQKVFPMVLEKAMELLNHLYARLKTSYGGPSAVQEQERLRSRARLLLFTFSGMLQRDIPNDVVTRMANIEKSMI